jgi:uncharacterized protein YwgA
MSRKERYALLAALMKRLHDTGSWCGETHLQKAVFFVQELLQVPFDYNFRLYRHGPYSFDLRDELASMHADDALRLRAQAYPYGPTLEPTERGERLMDAFAGLVERHSRDLDFIAARLGSKDVKSLERIATGFLVSLQMRESTQNERAERLHELKPHITMPLALDAVRDVDRLIEASEEIKAA